jgi:hypothetical protein
LETKNNIISVSKVVALFYIDYRRAPNNLAVEVIENDDGSFIGEANYSIWGPNQGSPYKSIRIKDSIHDALQDVLEGIIEFDDNSFPDDVLFWEAEDETLYDGTGEKVSLEEAERRRAEYRK